MRQVTLVCLMLLLTLVACEPVGDTNNGDDTTAQSVTTPTESADETRSEEPEPRNTPMSTGTAESTSSPQPSPSATPDSDGTSEQESGLTDPSESESCVDINTASEEELREIMHIDEERSQEIIDLRPFSSVEALTRVNGIGEVRLDEILEQDLACV